MVKLKEKELVVDGKEMTRFYNEVQDKCISS